MAQIGIRTLYRSISTTDNPKAQTFFSQWKILFGEVCGYDVDNPSDKVKKLAQFYGVPFDASIKPAELLFAVHTYYAIFMKLMASQIVSRQESYVSSPLKKLVEAPTSNKLKHELEEIEQGGIFRHYGITNFLEGDLFAWYVSVWDDEIEKLIRGMVQKLDDYNPNTLAENPAESRDLLKKLYHQLFPKSVRHDLGEYYTPDWLAEHTLNELGYTGALDKRLLDPACGSGTFLVMAINRIRAEFEKNRELVGFEEDDLCKRILANVIGFDLNPLAVMAARTNFLIAIRDLIPHVDHVEIPIYLCDAIMTPSEYGGLFAGGLGKAKLLKTAAAEFKIPTQIGESREDLAKYAEQLEFCIKHNYSPQEFLDRCIDEGLGVGDAILHEDLYKQLVQLDKENRNGVWARIIKNAFAPLFIGKVDYLAGNPPWVNWESLPEDYRNSMKYLWQDYGLFTLSGSAGRLGGGKKDLSMLFVYAGMDNYLSDGGKLGFVITQTVFKTKGAGDVFRRFKYERNGKTTYLAPVVVNDLSSMQVFEGATNRTAVLVCKKQPTKFKYPVAYSVWSGDSRISQDKSLEAVLEKTKISAFHAVPINEHQPTSPWLTAPPAALSALRGILGESDYRAFEGANTGGLNGCYWVKILSHLKNDSLFIKNLNDIGKIKVEAVEASVESEFVYPLLRGRDVQKWNASPSVHLLMVQDPEFGKGIDELSMKRKFPKTYSYLKRFEGEKVKPKRGTLRGRALFKLYFRPTDPFYSMYNVGRATLAPYKVVWREQSREFQAAKIGLRDGKPVIPDHKLMAIECVSEAEADYLTALLNSSPCNLMVMSYTVSTSTSTHVLEHVAIPEFDAKNALHLKLARLSSQCHSAAENENQDEVARLENDVDFAAAELWGITASELVTIQNSIHALSGSSLPEPEDDE